MAKPIPERELKAIEAVVSAHPEGTTMQDIQDELEEETTRRTLQYRLKHLVDEGRLARQGNRRWAKYLLPAAARRVHACNADSPGLPRRKLRSGLLRKNPYRVVQSCLPALGRG